MGDAGQRWLGGGGGEGRQHWGGAGAGLWAPGFLLPGQDDSHAGSRCYWLAELDPAIWDAFLRVILNNQVFPTWSTREQMCRLTPAAVALLATSLLNSWPLTGTGLNGNGPLGNGFWFFVLPPITTAHPPLTGWTWASTPGPTAADGNRASAFPGRFAP